MAFTGFEPTPDSGTHLSGNGDAVPHGAVPEADGFPIDPAPEAASLLYTYREALASNKRIPIDPSLYHPINDHTAEEVFRIAAENVRVAQNNLTVIAGLIGVRSAPHLGGKGMARKGGFRTPVKMAVELGKIPAADALRALEQGKRIHETQLLDTAEVTGTAPPLDPATGAPLVPSKPWLAAVARAQAAGLSAEAADAIAWGLGNPNGHVTAEILTIAVEQLLAEAARLDPDRLKLRSRRIRDELDAAGIGMREEERRQKRILTVVKQKDGMSRMHWLMDTETAAIVTEVYDRATSPKLGGPRTGDGPTGQHATRILEDERTPGQLASDTFAQLLVNGVAADSSLVLGTSIPTVVVLTTDPIPGNPAPAHPKPSNHSATDTLAPKISPDVSDTGTESIVDSNPNSTAGSRSSSDTDAGADAETEEVEHDHACQDGRDHRHRTKHIHRVPAAEKTYGPGWIEGQSEPVSAATIARLACTGSTQKILYDDSGQPINVSKEQRLYDHRQRRALASRDGGCMWTSADGTATCERPPSWTEAHHVELWSNGGKTTIANGISLCKHHHLTLHNDGWEIHRVGSRYWLIPPSSVSPQRTPRLIRSKSDAYRQLDALTHHTGIAAIPTAAPEHRPDTEAALSPTFVNTDILPPAASTASPPAEATHATDAWASTFDELPDCHEAENSELRSVVYTTRPGALTDNRSDRTDPNTGTSS